MHPKGEGKRLICVYLSGMKYSYNQNATFPRSGTGSGSEPLTKTSKNMFPVSYKIPNAIDVARLVI